MRALELAWLLQNGSVRITKDEKSIPLPFSKLCTYLDNQIFVFTPLIIAKNDEEAIISLVDFSLKYHNKFLYLLNEEDTDCKSLNQFSPICDYSHPTDSGKLVIEIEVESPI